MQNFIESPKLLSVRNFPRLLFGAKELKPPNQLPPDRKIGDINGIHDEELRPSADGEEVVVLEIKEFLKLVDSDWTPVDCLQVDKYTECKLSELKDVLEAGVALDWSVCVHLRWATHCGRGRAVYFQKTAV